MLDLSILTVTWNSVDNILDQITSVQSAAEGLHYEQLVADNASTDGTARIIREKFPNLFLITFDRNTGFGFANNELAKKAAGKYFLLLNPDMKLSSGSLASLIAWADSHPKAGIIGCRLMNTNGELNRKTSPRRFPTIWDQLLILLKFPHIFPTLLDRYLMKDHDFNTEEKVDAVQGAFMLVRRELYEKLGRPACHASAGVAGRIFDPRYFIWFEDVDLCREARRLGYEVWYSPIASAVDLSGRSFRQRSFVWKQWNFTVSMIKYFLKWGIWRS